MGKGAARNILIIDGHPDAIEGHFCHGLANAYQAGALRAGHSVRRLDLARLDIVFLRSQTEQENGVPHADIRSAQADIGWAEHIVLVFPLWLGGMPALVKAFFEQTLRPGFAYDASRPPPRAALLKGRSARVVITMGMPAWYYRLFYRAHSLKALKTGILGFVGLRPVSETLVGSVATGTAADRQRWLSRMERLGALAR